MGLSSADGLFPHCSRGLVRTMLLNDGKQGKKEKKGSVMLIHPRHPEALEGSAKGQDSSWV